MKNKNTHLRRHRFDGIGLAIVLIAAGSIVFAHKQGYLSDAPYHLLISWQMLLVVCGLWSLVKRQWKQGILLAGIGGFFLIPLLTGVGRGWAADYWPLLLVLAGVVIIAGWLTGHKKPESGWDTEPVLHETEDGFVHADTKFGGVKHIVLDPVFKGARLRNRFAGTALDLRHTTIVEGETYIDLNCTCGGIELFVPPHWNVVYDIDTSMGGVEDNRLSGVIDIDTSRKLVLRGRLLFGGVVVKY